MTTPAPILVACEHCNGEHVAEYHHDGRFGEGPIFGVWSIQCPDDFDWGYEVDFYTREAALFRREPHGEHDGDCPRGSDDPAGTPCTCTTTERLSSCAP